MIVIRRTVVPILYLMLVVFTLGVLGCSTLRPPDVEYVPTPHELVAEMLNVAEVTKDDVVYDLGCGDGRSRHRISLWNRSPENTLRVSQAQRPSSERSERS